MRFRNRMGNNEQHCAKGELVMTWIRTIPADDAKGALKKLYDRIKDPDGNVDNIMLAHSLRAHTMQGHMALYKNVLHHSGNKIDKWFLEALGVHVSMINECDYCVDHHFEGMRRLLDDNFHATAIRIAFDSAKPASMFDAKECAALTYAEKLTTAPGDINEGDIAALRDSGWDDGDILEINQVTAYFNYANRTVLGLGVTTEGDVLGTSPGKGTGWSHG